MTFTIGHTETISFHISGSDMEAFARLSGDIAPLHNDAAFARSKGFDGLVVYGGLLITKISQMIGMKLPGQNGVWVGFKINFRNPLYVDEQATLLAEIAGYSESVSLLALKLSIWSNRAIIATGSADILIKP